MAGYVDIANLAASKIGEDDQLRTPDDDTHLGRTVAAVWTTTRQTMLREHTWNFAKRRAALPAQQLAVAPDGWAWSYPVPPDNLRIIGLIDRSAIETDLYQLEGASLLSDIAAPLRIRYIADVVEPAYWDALFVEAFACRLAHQIADRITGSESRKAAAWTDYRSAIASAKRANAIENPRIDEEATSWETARWGYHDGFGSSWPRTWPTSWV